MFLSIILIGSIVFLIAVYLLGYSHERYWKKRGVKFYDKNKVTGVFWDFFTKKGAMFERFGELYKEYRSEPAVGLGSLLSPGLMVIHSKNIHHVLQTDFNSFHHRGMHVNEEDKLANNLIFMSGPTWKLVRQNMSPLFTSTKLKNMYYIVDKSAQDFVVYLNNNPKTREGGCFETLMAFCNAAVCGAIFGISSASIFDSPFLKMAKETNKSSLISNLKFSIMSMSPTLTKLLNIKVFKDFEDFFIGAIMKLVQAREKENIKRHDFGDVCIYLRQNGTMRDPTTGCELEPSYELLSAQAMFFLVAGVEPVATVIFATFIELGLHPDILARLHREIDEQFQKNNGKITYDVISEMKYLDKVISEAMRVNPPIGVLIRECMQDTVLPVNNIRVDKGTKMFMPIYEVHHDPKYYPNPDVFDPERFADVSKLGDDYYMPFGLGGRMCIGARYAKLQVASGIVHVLRHYTVKTKELGGQKFKTHLNNVRRSDVDVLFVPRNDK